MRSFSARKRGVVIATFAIAATALIAAGASAATIVMGAVQVKLGSAVPDLSTWALMLASFSVIGLGIRSRKRSVVLS
jgi:hypothetical protein